MGMGSSPGGRTGGRSPLVSLLVALPLFTWTSSTPPIPSTQAGNRLSSGIILPGRCSHGQIAARSPLGSAICLLKGWQPPL
ncbi:unnamed protein product, partial [Clonostachys rhizophaga]